MLCGQGVKKTPVLRKQALDHTHLRLGLGEAGKQVGINGALSRGRGAIPGAESSCRRRDPNKGAAGRWGAPYNPLPSSVAFSPEAPPWLACEAPSGDSNQEASPPYDLAGPPRHAARAGAHRPSGSGPRGVRTPLSPTAQIPAPQSPICSRPPFASIPAPVLTCPPRVSAST